MSVRDDKPLLMKKKKMIPSKVRLKYVLVNIEIENNNNLSVQNMLQLSVFFYDFHKNLYKKRS